MDRWIWPLHSVPPAHLERDTHTKAFTGLSEPRSVQPAYSFHTTELQLQKWCCLLFMMLCYSQSPLSNLTRSSGVCQQVWRQQNHFLKKKRKKLSHNNRKALNMNVFWWSGLQIILLNICQLVRTCLTSPVDIYGHVFKSGRPRHKDELILEVKGSCPAWRETGTMVHSADCIYINQIKRDYMFASFSSAGFEQIPFPPLTTRRVLLAPISIICY